MASSNPFDLLGDDDNDDPSQLIAAQQHKVAEKKPSITAPPPAKLPTKPLPPAQAMKAAKEGRNGPAPVRSGSGRGGMARGGGGGGRGLQNGSVNGYSGGYGGGGFGRGEEGLNERERDLRGPYRGFGSRGGYRGRGENGNGEDVGDSERPPRRPYERRSGTGYGSEMKRDGAGRGNWGTTTDVLAAQTLVNENGGENVNGAVKQPEEQNPFTENNKEGEPNEAEEKEEDKELTLEEYEKIREEKRQALLALKSEERKVDIDKELQSMQQLSSKKGNDDIFFKLGSNKDAGKKKETTERDEKNRKPVKITEIFKPADGERYNQGGRGRGRGRGASRGGFSGRGSNFLSVAPSIADPGQFPTLGGK